MKSFEEKLMEASGAWVGDGLITEGQRDVILARHPVVESGHSRFIAILATVGGLLLAIGVSLVVKANWEAIGDWVKIGGLVTLMAGAYGAGWQMKMRGAYPKIGDVFFMVGSLLFLVGIALVSQIFHLNARPASGLFAWWLGIVLVPWLTQSKGAQFVSLVAFLVWFGAEAGTMGSWIHVDDRSGTQWLSVYFLLGLAALFFGLALRGTRWESFAAMHEKWGLFILCGALYWLGFRRHWWRDDLAASVSLAVYAGAALALVAMAAGGWRRAREVKTLLPGVGLALVPVVGMLAGSNLGDDGWLWSALSWGSLFVLSIMIIRTGIETGREGWVNLGVLFVAANVLARYFDLFGTMLEGGVFFIVTGAIVLALGIYLERKRRSLVAKARKEMLA
jgi:uncharacterized membrane protein